MKTLDRYIASIFLRNFGLASCTLCILFVFQAFLGDLIDASSPPGKLLVYHALNIPQVFVQMTPPAILLGTVLSLSNLNRSNELVAMYAIGIGLKRVMSVVLSMVFIISCLSLTLQDRILPPLYKKRTTFYWREMKNKTDFFLDVKQDKIWYRSKNLIYNLKTFDAKTNTIHGMSIYSFDERFVLRQVIEAKKALFTLDGWKLLDGTVTLFLEDNPFPLNDTFAEKELKIEEKPKDFQEIEKEVDALRLKELYRYIVKTHDAGTDTKGFEVKFHSRISLSFIPLVMSVLGVPFSTRSRREGGLALDLTICLVITFLYWLFYSVGLSLGTNGALPPWVAAWLPSFVFAVFAGVLVSRKQA